MILLLTSLAIAQSWEDTIARVSPSIVSIQVSSNRYFDTERTSSSVATGFVVDAELGIILTNRHVVEPGPVSAKAILLNSEEVSLKPIYRDPIHDFGFYQYDPSEVRFLELRALSLCLDCAQVGLDVRLIGNDAGEKISILEATLARLDRQSPNYGIGRFNDFNTFYYQAAAGSSGGSSGSPVLNQNGEVVALNAGGRSSAASSFFLPLDRIDRALKLVQENKAVSRGGLLGTLQQVPFPDAKRLGLSSEEEVAFRSQFPETDGVLVLKQIVPDGPLSEWAKVGDVLISIDGQRISGFVELDALLDNHVGDSVALEVQRAGKTIKQQVTVADLHLVSPDELIIGCNGSFNDLSYQLARHYNIPIQGVTIAFAGYCFSNAGVERGNVIKSIDGQQIDNTDQLWTILQQIEDDQPIEVTYFSFRNPRQMNRRIVHWDRTWFPLEKWTRNDEIGRWTIEQGDDAPEAKESQLYPQPNFNNQQISLPKRDKWGVKIQDSLVTIKYSIPLSVEGVYGNAFFGAGVVVDAERGLISVDRDTVPIALGDLEIIFAGEVRVPGQVVYLHPEHNIALVQFDVSQLPEGSFSAINMGVPESDAGFVWNEGEPVLVYGLNYDYVFQGAMTELEKGLFLQMPSARRPFFREANLEVGVLKDSKDLVGGVVLNKRGELKGQWGSFPDLSSPEQERNMYVIPTFVIQEAIASYLEKSSIRTLGVEFTTLNWIDASEFGLSQARIQSFGSNKRPDEWFMIDRVSSNAPSASKLQNGDILIAVEGGLIENFRKLERIYRLQSDVELTILRRGELHNISVETLALENQTQDLILGWGGALIHDVPWYASMQSGSPMEGAYVAWCWSGSPCGRDRLYPTLRIVSVDQQTVNSVQDVVNIVSNPECPLDVRIEVETLKGKPSTIVLETDTMYWGTEVLERSIDTNSWTRTKITQ